MGLESVTWIDDFVITNPTGADKKKQGDDHLRAIKTGLRNSLPRAGKAFRFPKAMSKTADYSVVAADDNTLIYVDTTAGTVTLTLPTLASTDDGWRIKVIKTNTGTNPVFITPPSGTLNGFSKIRRTLEYLITEVVWTGSNFFANRPNGGNIGESRTFYGIALPNDLVWPDGTAFTAANYVELNTILGGNTKPDIRGLVQACRDDVGGSAASRIGTVITDSGTIVGTTLQSKGGSSTHVQTASELAQHSHTGSVGEVAPVFTSPSIVSGSDSALAVATGAITNNPTFTTNNSGSSTAMPMLQPTIIANVGIVAE